MQEPANDNPQLALARINASLGRARRNFGAEPMALSIATFCVLAFIGVLVLLLGGPQ